MKSTRTTISMTDHDLKVLKRNATERGMSVSALIREMSGIKANEPTGWVKVKDLNFTDYPELAALNKKDGVDGTMDIAYGRGKFSWGNARSRPAKYDPTYSWVVNWVDGDSLGIRFGVNDGGNHDLVLAVAPLHDVEGYETFVAWAKANTAERVWL